MADVKEFSSGDLSLKKDPSRIEYARRTGELKNTLHWGQRKLLISEILFFTFHADPNEKILCVYAGAASGTHIPILSMMYPNVEFHLYDPSKFTIKETDRIKIFTGEENGLFTNETAEKYRDKDVYFISDIRRWGGKSHILELFQKNNISVNNDGEPIQGKTPLVKELIKESEKFVNEKIMEDQMWMQEWVEIMNPKEAYLKFRFSYPEDGKEKVIDYLKGIVYFQPWVGATSTECRLKPVKENGQYVRKMWSNLEYEEWLFYHNVKERNEFIWKNIFTGGVDAVDAPELLNDYDSMFEAYVLMSYLKQMGQQGTIEEVGNLSRTITEFLGNPNYRIYKPATLESIRNSKNKRINNRK